MRLNENEITAAFKVEEEVVANITFLGGSVQWVEETAIVLR